MCRFIGLAALVLVLASAIPARAAEPFPTPPVLDRRLCAAIIDTLKAEVMRSCIEVDTARLITDHTRRRLNAEA